MGTLSRDARSGLAALAFATLFAVAGCTSDGPPPQAGDCYDLVAGSWSQVEAVTATDLTPAPDASGDSLMYALPVRIRLEESLTSASDSSALRIMSIPPEALQLPHQFLAWRMAADTLVLLTSTGNGGTITHLLADSDGWAGTATTHEHTATRPIFRRPVQAARVGCESPPPVPASEGPLLPRTVELQSGALLSLGEPLPGGSTPIARSAMGVLVGDEPAGAWAGAEAVWIYLGRDSLIWTIRLRYPPGTRLESLIDTLETEYDLGGRTGDGRGGSWTNRTTTFRVASNAPPRVQLEDPRLRPR